MFALEDHFSEVSFKNITLFDGVLQYHSKLLG